MKKLIFRLGKRTGVYETMDDMTNPVLYARVESLRSEIEQSSPGGVEAAISKVKETYL